MSIVEPTIVELADKTDCRYTLVVAASRRARQILSGAQPLIDAKEMKPLKQAVEEIHRGLLSYSRVEEEV